MARAGLGARVGRRPGTATSTSEQKHQAADEADAQRHAVGEPMPAGAAGVGPGRDFADTAGLGHVTEDLTNVAGVLLVVATHNDHHGGDEAADDDAGAE